MPKRTAKKKPPKIPLGVDNQELALSPSEQHCLRLREEGFSFHAISEAVYLGTKTRQAVQQIIQRATRKQWRLDSKNRYEDRPGDCPIEEVPLPARTRAALQAHGETKLGQLAGISEGHLSDIEGVGSYGAHLIVKLLIEYGIRGSKRKIKCPHCKMSFAA